MQKVWLAAGLVLASALAGVCQTVVVSETNSPLATYAAGELRAAAHSAQLGRVVLSISTDLPKEGFRIRKASGGYSIAGGDARGVMYGALAAAEQVALTGGLKEQELRPALGVRALKMNIPLQGTGYLSEEDLAHNQWFWDLEYWRKYLDMAARDRYNALTLWSAHPFGRMVHVAKYPEAAEVPSAELDRNIQFFRKIFQMAADRGIDTYLITWNIHVSRSFAEHHKVPESGFDSPLVRDYQRECIKSLLATYPMLTGIGTAAGERMPDMTARQKMDWLADTYFAALRDVGRPVPFILRYWQADPVELAAMLDRVKPAGPIYLDIKFNGEHMYSSTKPHVQDHRWMELAGKRYRLLWHLRNDDIFILRWGDPDFVRAFVGQMVSPKTAGFVEGSEIDVPGTDWIHTAAAKAHVDWTYKFEKFWFRYMLWGRMGYNPEEPEDTWRAIFTEHFGKAGPEVYEALKQASKIAPLITSYHWNYMNGDWYVEGSIGSWNTSFEQPRRNYRRATMYHDVRTYIFNNTIDNSMANIPEWVAGARQEGPLDVAARLEGYGRKALELIASARPKVERGQKEFACTEADIQASGNLGIYYAEKLRGAAYLGRFELLGNEKDQAESVVHLQRALAAWRSVVAATVNHYIPHEVWLFGQFDWKRYTPDVEHDIQIAKEAKPFRSTYDVEGMHDWLVHSFELLGRPVSSPTGARPVSFQAATAESVTAPLELRDGALVMGAAAAKRAGDSITGARDFISSANSAIYHVEIPADGDYKLQCQPAAGGFNVLVDESNTSPVVLSESILSLGAGPHTVRFMGRRANARLQRCTLSPAKAER